MILWLKVQAETLAGTVCPCLPAFLPVSSGLEKDIFCVSLGGGGRGWWLCCCSGNVSLWSYSHCPYSNTLSLIGFGLWLTERTPIPAHLN